MHFYKYGPGLGFRIKLYNRVPVVCGVRSRFVPKFKGRGKKKKGLRAKLSAEIEIKSSPESYFKRLKEELHHLPDAASGVHGVEVHEGDFKTHGSVKSWTYTLGMIYPS